MPNFFESVIKSDERFHSTERVRDLMLLEPVTRAAVNQIIVDALKEYGIVLVVTETFRSRERQEMLYAEGKSQLKEVGTHFFGISADFARIEGEHAVWNKSWLFLGELAAKHGMNWGGSWPHFKDWVHVQRCSVEDQARLFAGEWYPEPVQIA